MLCYLCLFGFFLLRLAILSKFFRFVSKETSPFLCKLAPLLHGSSMVSSLFVYFTGFHGIKVESFFLVSSFA